MAVSCLLYSLYVIVACMTATKSPLLLAISQFIILTQTTTVHRQHTHIEREREHKNYYTVHYTIKSVIIVLRYCTTKYMNFAERYRHNENDA